MHIQDPNQRIGVINALRAFAALFVAWGHFVAGQGKYLSLSGKYGYLGVHIFFVISGFVIPWSLYRGKYVLRDYPRFLLKRCVRLYPPYLASIVVTILATNFVLAPMFHLPALTVTGRSLLLHFAYLNDLAGVPWFSVVYWTLAIEFQWYLLAGLMLPLLASRSAVARFTGIAAMTALYFVVPQTQLVFHSVPIFLVGVFVFQYRARLIGLGEMLGLIAVMAFAMRGPIAGIVAGVSVATGLLIAFSTLELRALNPLGDASYSVYLLHLPIGVAVIGCLSHWLPYSGSYIGVLDVVGVVASVLVASLVYRTIEKPSQDMSSAIRFAHHDRQRASRAPIAAATVEPVGVLSSE